MTPAFMIDRAFFRARFAVLPLAALLWLGSACSNDDDGVIPPGEFDPEITDIRTTWLEEGWVGRDPMGTPAVQLFWQLPDEWEGEVFRIYSRSGGSGDYLLIATVTSCIDRQCVYTDTNVEAGRSYDYFVAAVDDRTNEEVGESEVWDIAVPQGSQPSAPTGLSAVPLDNSVYLRWDNVEAGKYRIFLEGVDDEALFFEVGATDGAAYVDTRAENGSVHTYSVAAVAHPEEGGYVSRRSETISVIPRPDYHAELIYVNADSALASGFRFRATEGENPIVPGSSTEAQWRLEASGSGLRIVPVNGTRVTSGIFTTDLSCGPGSEADCEYVAEAPSSAAFGTAPVAVSAGNTHVFEVTAGGETHFGKIRVHGGAEDSAGRRVLVFDWAYQLVPGEPSLNLSPVAR